MTARPRLFVLALLIAYALLNVAAGAMLFGQTAVFDRDPTQLTLLSTAALVSAALIGLSVWRASRNSYNAAQVRAEIGKQARIDAQERAKGIYLLASALGSSLEYKRVLEAALDVGVFGLREMKYKDRIVGMVMLFRHKALQIVSARGVTPQDQKKVISGHQGVIGEALRSAEPVIADDARNDPELQYFAALQDTKSILCIPLRARFENYGVLLFATVIQDAFSHDDIDLLSAIGAQATIALQNAVLYDNLLKEKERLIEAEEEARKKLARDLHDGPTQSISAIAMRVSAVRNNIEQRRVDTLMDDLSKIEVIAQRTTTEIRDMLFTLRPLVLESQGLPAALRQFASKMKESHNLEVLLEVQPRAEELIDGSQQGVLFYIIEEAVNNARKHAQANHIDVRLYRRDKYLAVEVQDDGVGFDVGEVGSNYDERGSLGMINMRERASMIDGLLDVQSAPGNGTKISVLIPMRESSRAIPVRSGR